MQSLLSIKQRFEIIGASVLLDRAIEKAMLVAPTDISVMVTGESGVGKENIPKIIHALSARKHQPYIAVNCGAIPEGTIDSELFGHEKGSFTGATQARKGYFEEANSGTIFLDEVAELPLATQVRLLRVLETGEFMKVGSSKVEKTDVRIVAATNVGMLEAINKGKFREDLYYRLNTVEIKIPSLRERKEDIHLLFRKFAADFAAKYHMPPIRLTEEAVEIISNYRWPGNIRQLKNFAEQISVIERERLVNGNAVMLYLPEASGNQLPMEVNQRGNGQSFSDFGSERDILYKVLYDMRNDLYDLKKLSFEILANNGAVGEAFHEENAQLIQRVFDKGLKEKPTAKYSPVSVSGDVEEVIDADEVVEESLSLQDKEIEMIRKALARNRGKRKDAARELGISERTLYRKIKQFNM